MGLPGAPGIFQSLMKKYLLKFLGDFVLSNLDDILLDRNNYKDHPEHILWVLEVL
jgi:hypothetical protein